MPLTAVILAAPSKVTAPAQELAPLALTRAPALETPEPLIARVSLPTLIPPDIESIAPSDTVVPFAEVPRALKLEMARVPVLTVVVPV